MQRISVHISDETKQRIDLAARAKNMIEAELIREALDKGLKIIYPKSSSAQALLDFAKKAEKISGKPGSPSDLSENLDHYAWGGPKRNER